MPAPSLLKLQKAGSTFGSQRPPLHLFNGSERPRFSQRQKFDRLRTEKVSPKCSGTEQGRGAWGVCQNLWLRGFILPFHNTPPPPPPHAGTSAGAKARPRLCGWSLPQTRGNQPSSFAVSGYPEEGPRNQDWSSPLSKHAS